MAHSLIIFSPQLIQRRSNSLLTWYQSKNQLTALRRSHRRSKLKSICCRTSWQMELFSKAKEFRFAVTLHCHSFFAKIYRFLRCLVVRYCDPVPITKVHFYHWCQVRKTNENFFKKFAFFRRTFSISGKYIL